MDKQRAIKAVRRATDTALDNRHKARPFVKDKHYYAGVAGLKLLSWAFKLLDKG